MMYVTSSQASISARSVAKAPLLFVIIKCIVPKELEKKGKNRAQALPSADSVPVQRGHHLLL